MKLEHTCFYYEIYRVCPNMELTGIAVYQQVSGSLILKGSHKCFDNTY